MEAALGLAESFITNSKIFGIVAEMDGKVLGSNFLMEGDAIRGVGPITVAPEAQGAGVGRALMQAVLDRAQGSAGVRLLQDSFNMRSIALYASLGFEVREPVLVISGRPGATVPAGITVRAMRAEDLDACDALCQRVHGISRRQELVDSMTTLTPMVGERDGRIKAYMTAPDFWIANHGVAESAEDMAALITGAGSVVEVVSFLLPTRQADLFRWCLAQGMTAVKPMTLMSAGSYNEPVGTYLPSVFY
ncbi:MAG: GNAT family N-acetyltransferase [Rhodospirillaceae bacterium]|nr:GNAT family N-acetyltransferase [Rhodospirillaceae bacterium]